MLICRLWDDNLTNKAFSSFIGKLLKDYDVWIFSTYIILMNYVTI